VRTRLREQVGPVPLGVLCVNLWLLIFFPCALVDADVGDEAFNLALEQLNNKEYVVALEAFAAFKKDFPDHPRVREAALRCGECLYRLGRYAEAAQSLHEFVTANPRSDETPPALWWQADALLHLGRHRQAAEAYARLARDFPTHELARAARYWQGESLRRAGEVELALVILDDVVREGDEKFLPLALHSAGLAEFAQGDYATALERFQALVKKYPQHETSPEAAAQAAECLVRLGRNDAALVAYSELETRYGARFRREILLGRARIALAKAEHATAAHLFESVAAEFPADAGAEGARFNAASAWFAAGDYARAAEIFAVLGSGKGERAALSVYWQAKCLVAQGQYAEAAPLFARAAAALTEPETRANALVAAGDALMAAQQPAAAAERYLEAHQVLPGGTVAATALYSAAVARSQEGRLDDAIVLCRRVLEIAPADGGDLRSRATFALGEFLFRKQDFQGAVAAFRTLEGKPPSGVAPVTLLSRLAWATYHVAAGQSAADFRRILKEHPNSSEAAEAAFMLGWIAGEREQRYDEALAAYRSCARDYPGTEAAARATVEAGAVLLRQRQFAEARRTLAAFVQSPPANAVPLMPRALVLLGGAELEDGDAAGALARYASALSALKAVPDASLAAAALRGMGFALRALGRHAEAAARFDECTERFPQDAQADVAIFWAGRSYEEAGELAQAVARYERLRAQVPESGLAAAATYHSLACRTRLPGTDRESLSREYAEFLARFPQSEYIPNAIYDLAWIWREAGEKARAAAEFERLLREHPQHILAAEAAFYLGEMKYEGGDYAAAAGYYQRVLAWKEISFRDKVLYKLGWAQERLERKAEALAAFGAVAKEHPHSELAAESAYRAGRLARLQGQFDAAVTYLSQVRGELEDHAACEIGQVELARHNWNAAQACFERALVQFPQSALRPEMLLGLGLALFERGAYDEATRVLQEVVRTTDTVTAAHAQFTLGQVQFARGEYAAAGREFIKVVFFYRDGQWKPKALVMAARAYDRAGEPDRAARYYGEVLNQYPDSLEAKVARAELDRLTGRRP